MKDIFISYSRDDLAEVEQLIAELNVRGLSVWQDVKDLGMGSPSEEEIQSAIANECDAVLVYLSPNVLKKPDYVVDVELRAAYKTDPLIPIIPVFRNIEISDAKNLTINKLGEDISLRGGVPVPDTISDLSEKFQEIAKKVLATHIKQYPANLDLSKNKIHFITSHYKLSDEEPMLKIDWVKQFENGELRPSEKVWIEQLLPALKDVKSALKGHFGRKTFSIQAYARLSAGFALGFVFREIPNIIFEQEFYNGSTQEWLTRESFTNDSPLSVKTTPGDISSRDLSIELNIAQDASSGVTDFIQANSLFRARVQLNAASIGRDSIKDNQQALAIAEQVFNEIQENCQKYNIDKIHIFASIPVGLAFLIAHKLNACKPVQCYEYDNAKGYMASCLLS